MEYTLRQHEASAGVDHRDGRFKGEKPQTKGKMNWIATALLQPACQNIHKAAGPADSIKLKYTVQQLH